MKCMSYSKMLICSICCHVTLRDFLENPPKPTAETHPLTPHGVRLVLGKSHPSKGTTPKVRTLGRSGVRFLH